ncbi:MAG TPA: AMP-binding protein, partial [Pyrinomonadaceae bacterium]|nr:AMP-binding protein [Pyrinomonadaceae bacterium]
MIFRSPHAPITIPDISLPDYVLANAEEHGDKPALIDGPSGRVITYAQLRPMIRRLAAGFSSYGVKQNDVVAILSPNLPEYVLAFHAIASLGAITTMVPPLFTDEEIGRQLRDSGARYLLTIPPLIARAREAGRGSNVSRTFVIGEAENAVSFASLLNTTEDAPPVRIERNADLAALPYSSGTTGFPKGVMLSHRNLVAMLCQLNANEPLTEKDTMICVVP